MIWGRRSDWRAHEGLEVGFCFAAVEFRAGVGAQQAAAPTPGQMKKPPATQDKAPQLSEKDQGLACPAEPGRTRRPRACTRWGEA